MVVSGVAPLLLHNPLLSLPLTHVSYPISTFFVSKKNQQNNINEKTVKNGVRIYRGQYIIFTV